MVPIPVNQGESVSAAQQQMIYIKQMLVQLSAAAREQREDLLAYLIDMAIEETQDIVNRGR